MLSHKIFNNAVQQTTKINHGTQLDEAPDTSNSPDQVTLKWVRYTKTRQREN